MVHRVACMAHLPGTAVGTARSRDSHHLAVFVAAAADVLQDVHTESSSVVVAALARDIVAGAVAVQLAVHSVALSVRHCKDIALQVDSCRLALVHERLGTLWVLV